MNKRLHGWFRRSLLLPLIVTTGMLFLCSSSYAARADSTLERIKENKSINIGFRELPPFSYTDSDGKLDGYTISLCRMIVQHIGTALGLKKVTINYIKVDPTDRLKLLNTRVIDMDCSVNADTEERRKSVAFSHDYYTAAMHVISLRQNKMHTLTDLKGRAISVVGGTKNMLMVNEINRNQHLNLSLVTSKSRQLAFDKMEKRQTAALLLDDVLALPLIKQSGHSKDFVISPEKLGSGVNYAIMLRKDDPRFTTLINQLMDEIVTSPDGAVLRNKWQLPTAQPRHAQPQAVHDGQ